jgi:8-oxo-dGTP pyrophosphatase MutT (NUDIX family)
MIDLAQLRARIAARPRADLSVTVADLRAAAVLLPIVVEPGVPERLLFTLRHDGLSTHAGQISFPGGKREADDVDAAACAVRETREELGIEPAAVEVLGQLDDVPTPTGFLITPVVASVRGPLHLTPSAGEVAEVLDVRLDELARPETHRADGTRELRGIVYVMHEYHLGGHRIWGATARMVHELLALVA